MIIAYNYYIDKIKQKGLQFGNELSQIQDDVAQLQAKFYSEKTKWEERDISKKELLEYYEKHIQEFEKIIARYDKLTPPQVFQSSVDLFKISSQTQLDSDIQFVEWIATGNQSARIRSDTQIQQSYQYENLGLVEFQLAKKGIKNYDEQEKFSPPPETLKNKVIQVYENMKRQCEEEFLNLTTEFTEIDVKREMCIDKAKQWKVEHLPK